MLFVYLARGLSFFVLARWGVISSAIIKFENDKSNYVMGNFSITDLSVDLITTEINFTSSHLIAQI